MSINNIKKYLLLLCILIASQYSFSQAPIISSFSPANGPVGTTVTLTGANFSSVLTENVVYFGPVKAQVISAIAGAGGSLVVQVPPGAAYGQVSVVVNGLVAYSPLSFVVTYPNGGSMFDTGDAFGPKINFAINTPGNGFPFGIRAADFDGDGKPDMVVMDAASDQLFIFKNTGSATTPFAATPTLKVTSNFRHSNVNVADLNGDGKLDIMTSNYGGGTIIILKNTSTPGNLSFASKSPVTLGANVNAVEAADFDGDGRLDIAATDGTTNTVKVKLNTGTGTDITFGAEQSFAVGNNPLDIALGDVDGDGKADMVTCDYGSGSVSVLRNTCTTGVLSFADKLSLIAWRQPYNVLLCDLDGDGKQEIITTNHFDFGNALTGYIFRNTGSVGTPSFDLAKEYYHGPFLSPPEVADMDGDGKPDLVVVDRQEDFGSIVRNRSTPGNVSLVPYKQFATYGYATSVAVADFNGDGKPDVVVSDSETPNVVSLQLNQVDPLRPTVASCEPAKAAEGNTVTLNGTNFTGVTSVSFGGKPATSYTVVSPTVITAVVPLTVSGNATVTTANGTGNFFDFVFIPKPAVSKVTVTTAGSVKTYTITGLYFGSTSAVSFDGVPATSFTNTDNNTITAKAGLTIPSKITITTPGGTTNYNYFAPPTIAGFTPKSAVAGTDVTITGTNFTGATKVNFGGVAAASYVVNSSSTITATVGTGATGTLSVVTPGGTANSSGQFSFIGQPAITSFSPRSAKPGQQITLTGTNFSGATSVTLGGVAATLFGNNGTSLTVTVVSGASGDIVVTTPGGTASISGFTYVPAPKISYFTTNIKTGGTVTITGIHFNGVTAVSFGGVPAQSFTVNSETSISAIVGLGSSGNVSVTSPLGTSTSSGFTYVPSAPVITSFTPLIAGTQQEVNIIGTDFIGTTAVRFGGIAAASFKINSISSITAIVAAGASGNVTVTTSYGTGILAGFNFTGSTIINGFSPTTAKRGQPVTITGSNLTGATAVSFGGKPASSFTVNSASSITAVPGDGASGDVTVVTPGGTANLAGFTFDNRPTITAFAPSHAKTGATVTVTGINLTGVTGVKFGGVTAASFTVNSPTSVTATVGAGASGDIELSNPDGSEAIAGFVYDAIPAIYSFSPNSAQAGATVNITGINFTGATSVTFGGAAAQSFTVNSSTSISAVVGASVSGSVAITTANGSASQAGFVYKPTPVLPGINSFAPVKAGPNQTVTISGNNFTGATAVSFGGMAAKSFIVNSASSITAVVNTGASGSISVTTPGGNTSLAGFVFEPAPVIPIISSFAPTTATLNDVVTISGSNFTGATGVSFGGVAAKSFTVVSAKSITAVIANGATGSVSITTPGGDASLAGFIFKVPVLVPLITNITPEISSYGRVVSISGANFSSSPTGNTVYFGAAKGSVFEATPDKLSVDAPYGGINEPVSVTTNGLTAYSPKAFVPGSTTSIAKFDSTSFESQMNFDTDKPTKTIVTADLDGDGKVDIVNVNYEQYKGNSITINKNSSMTGALAFANKTTITTGVGITTVGAGDVNGDGKLDLIVNYGDVEYVNGALDKNYIAVYLNNSTPGTIKFDLALEVKSLAASGMITVRDLDGDGLPEIVALGSVVKVFKNLSIGNTVSFAAPVFISNTQSSEANILFTDIDGDNKPDFVLTKLGASKSTLVVFRNTSSQSAISFNEIGSYPLVDAYGGRIAAADFDNDGKVDFVVTAPIANLLSVFKNTTVSANNITFADRIDYPSAKFPMRVTVADLNNDGYADIVVSNGNARSVSVFSNATVTGKPLGFLPKIDYATNSIPESLSVADLDNDGMPDIIVGYAAVYNNFTVLRNNMLYKRPVITDFTPKVATRNNLVTITGENLNDVTAVKLGGVPASFKTISPTTINVIVGMGASGAVEIFTQKDTAGLKGFIYKSDPFIKSFAPTSAKQGDMVTLTGSGFADVDSVEFGNVKAASFKVLSDSVITAYVGEGATGKIFISTGFSSTTTGPFTFISTKPFITSIYPAIGSAGTVLPIKGVNLENVIGVAFGGTPAQSFKMISPTEISAVIGNGTSGEVSVTTTEGKAVSNGFIYVPKPVIKADGPTTFTTGGSVLLYNTVKNNDASYRWYKNESPIRAGDGTTLTVTESGVYKLMVTVGNYSVYSDSIVVKSVFMLPATNFKIAAQSVTCRGQKNGSITIEAVKSYNYKAIITGPSGVNNQDFDKNKLALTSLAAGTYNICITIPEQPGYQQCFTVIVSQPADLAVYAVVNKRLNSLTLNLAGSDAYEVRLNNEVIRTSDSHLTIPLNEGSNKLLVITGLECQGVFEQIINVTGNHAPYPNPFVDRLDVNIGEVIVKTTEIKIYDVANGRQVLGKIYHQQSGTVSLDVSGLKSGVYSVHLSLDNVQSVYKIIKK